MPLSLRFVSLYSDSPLLHRSLHHDRVATFDPTEELTEESLRDTWAVCTKLARVLEQGSRESNLAWRLSHMDLRRREARLNARTTVESEVSSPSFEWPKAASTAPSTRAPSPSNAFARPITNTASLSDWIASSTVPTPAWNVLFDSSNTPPPSVPPPSAEPVSDSQVVTPVPGLPDNLGDTMEAMFKEAPLFENDFEDERQSVAPSTTTETMIHAPIPAFASSYGHYQPVSGPYSRFLTPSPGPSLLENLDELVGEYRSSRAASPREALAAQQLAESQQHQQPQQSHQGMLESIWTALSGSNSSPESSHQSHQSQAMSVGIHGPQTFENARTAFEMELARQGQLCSDQSGSARSNAATFMPNLMSQHQSGPSSNESSPYGSLDETAPIASSSKVQLQAVPSGMPSRADSPDFGNEDAEEVKPDTRTEPKKQQRKKASEGSTVRKSRNPHATQLPGEGSRKQAQIEADEGHTGPVCSHCSSIVTPLWRRGPNDELLCNACGLYLKLHGKSRPISFAKERSQKAGRTNLGVAAQAAASGVVPSCHNCGATSTPMWRKDADGQLSCNACSLYFKLHNKHRPAKLNERKKRRSAATSASAAKKDEAKAAVSPDSNGSNASQKTSPPTLPAPTQQPQPTLVHPSAQQQQHHLLPTFPLASTTTGAWRPMSMSPRPRQAADDYEYERLTKRSRIDESWERSTSPSNSKAHSQNGGSSINSPNQAPTSSSTIAAAAPAAGVGTGPSPSLHHIALMQDAAASYGSSSGSNHYGGTVLHPAVPPASLPQPQPQPQAYAGLPLSAVGQQGYWNVAAAAYPMFGHYGSYPGGPAAS